MLGCSRRVWVGYGTRTIALYSWKRLNGVLAFDGRTTGIGQASQSPGRRELQLWPTREVPCMVERRVPELLLAIRRFDSARCFSRGWSFKVTENSSGEAATKCSLVLPRSVFCSDMNALVRGYVNASPYHTHF